MPDDDTTPARPPLGRRAIKTLTRMAAYGSAILLVIGPIGQVLRDRSIATALLMYIPLLPVGAVAVVLDLACKGRSLPRIRFGLSVAGLAAMAWSAHELTGSASSSEPARGDREVSVLHWNVQWGGGLFRGPATWAAQRAAMVQKKPDIVVLSEAPPRDWLDRLVSDLGPGASYVGIQHDPRNPYWFHLAACSRWPIRLEGHLRFPGGSGMSIVAEVPGRPLRLLAVDGVSSPFRSRLPFLRAIADAGRAADASGKPYDLILGDFNTPSRSLGFGELEALDYRLTGRSSPGWRGTFPAWLPVYDIDHVWLARDLGLASCTYFNGPHSDHRGQVVRILLPKEDLP
jgi:endonuclease/exonuclease/phosphatase family metal-dependent hydrolase